jgi:hypothetical protein
VWLAINEAVRHKLEEIMLPQGYVPQSPFAKRIMEEHAKIRAEGHQKGLAEGLAEGLADALLRIVTARGLRLNAKQKQRVQQCTDPGALQDWIDRAVTAASAADIFSDAQP